MKRQAVKDLMAGAIDTKPVDFDFGQGYTESWEYWDAEECECGTLVVGSGYTECPKCGTEVMIEGPMMNYYYPLPGSVDVEEYARSLYPLPLCLVRIDDENTEERYALALTGGGMDFSWQICEAFMRLGYLPPIHFSLPRMAYALDARRRWVIAGMRKALLVSKMRADTDLRDLRNLVTWYKERATA